MTPATVSKVDFDAVAALVARLERRVHELESQPPEPATKTTDFLARPDQTVIVEPPAAGIKCSIVKATKFNRGTTIQFIQRNDNRMVIRAIDGLVNGMPFVTSNARGTFFAVSDGEKGWLLDQGIGPAGVAGAPGTPSSTVANPPGLGLPFDDDSPPMCLMIPNPPASKLSQQFDDTVAGVQDPYLLPRGFQSGDSLVWVITAEVTLRRIRDAGNAILPDGFIVYLSLRDQSGGTAPGFGVVIEDTGAVSVDGSFRTPGQVQGTSPGPDYVMRSEEEGIILVTRQGNWRLLGGTAAQAVTGDVRIASGNGSTRDSKIEQSRLPLPPLMPLDDDLPFALAIPGPKGDTGACCPKADNPGWALPFDDDGPAMGLSVPWSWASVLSVGNHSGPYTPIIDDGQLLRFETATATSFLRIGALGLGEDWSIQASATPSVATMGIVAGTSVEVRNGLATCAVHVEDDGSNGVRLLCPVGRQIRVESPKGLVIQTSAATATGGILKVGESSTLPSTVAAAQVGYWGLADTPSRAVATDDTGVDRQLENSIVNQITVSTVSALTTVLATTPTYTAAANRLLAGSQYLCRYAFLYTRGATATAHTISVFFDVATFPSITGLVAPTAAGTYLVEVEALLTVLTTGAGGTAMGWITASVGSQSAANEDVGGNGSTSFALDTTVATAMRGAAQMNTAVAGTSIATLGGFITPVN